MSDKMGRKLSGAKVPYNWPNYKDRSDKKRCPEVQINKSESN